MRYLVMLFSLLTCSALVSADTYYTCTDSETGNKAFSRTPCGADAEKRRETKTNVVDLGGNRQRGYEEVKGDISPGFDAGQSRNSIEQQQNAQLIEEFKRREKECLRDIERRLKPGQFANVKLIMQCRNWRADLPKYVSSNKELVRLQKECLDDVTRRLGPGVQPNAKLVIQCKGGSAYPRKEAIQTPSAIPPMPSIPSAPIAITNCDSGGCFDHFGQRYNGSGGPIYIRQDGRTCQRMGGMMQCN